MKIVCDQRIPFVDEAFGHFGQIVKCDSRAIDSTIVKDADALLVRSETKVDEKLIGGSKVRFVGTATIGTDHVEHEFLKRHGITFASAPGCNSWAVVQYIFSAIFTLAGKHGFKLKDKKLGVVGVGNIGSKIVSVAEKMGIEVAQNDPPRFRKTGDNRFVNLDGLMDSDIITIHVPYTRAGTDPTHHLFGAERLARMKKGSIIINSSRGAVIDNQALKAALGNGTPGMAVLDVWEKEPNIDIELLPKCEIGTQHIAGYSIDGKMNATSMIYNAFCGYFGFDRSWNSTSVIAPPDEPVIRMKSSFSDSESAISEVVRRCYDITKDDARLRQIADIQPEDRGRYFKELRGKYKFRYEFSNMTVEIPKPDRYLEEVLRSFRFNVRTETNP